MPVLILGLMREKSNLLGGRLSTTKASGRFLKQLTRTAFRWLALRLQYPQWEPFSSRMHIKRVTTEITMSIWTLSCSRSEAGSAGGVGGGGGGLELGELELA